MSESASCSTSDFDSEAQLTGRSSLSASPSPPKALKSFKAPARDSPVPRLGLNVPKLAASQAPQASVRRPDKLDMTAALSIDILSSAVQLSGSQRAEQDLPKTRRELSERLGVPAQSLSFYEVRLLDDQGQPSSSGQRLAVHISGSGAARRSPILAGQCQSEKLPRAAAPPAAVSYGCSARMTDPAFTTPEQCCPTHQDRCAHALTQYQQPADLPDATRQRRLQPRSSGWPSP